MFNSKFLAGRGQPPARPRITCMKTNITKIGAALLAIGLCLASPGAFAQTTTTVTTSNGAFTEYVPNSQTVVVRTETNSTPLRYTVTKQTTIVDEAGAPVAIERISPGSQLAVDYSGSGERLVASRIVVRKPVAVTAPVTTTVPVTTTAPAVSEKQTTTTTTTTTAPLTREEKHAVKEARKERKEEMKDEIERKKDALEKAKDKLDDDDDD